MRTLKPPAKTAVAVLPRFRHERNIGALHRYWSFDMPVDVVPTGDLLYIVSRAKSLSETAVPRTLKDTSVMREEERYTHRVTVWTRGGEPSFRFGGAPGAKGELIWPVGAALLGDRLYFTDEASHDVRVFDRKGEWVATWSGPGTEPGRLKWPAGIAVAGDGSLVVVDSGNHRVQRFTPDGRPLAAWGARGKAPGQLERPWGVAVDARGDVYVSDWGNDRVQKFAPEGRLLQTFGSPGSGDGRLRRPTGVAVDSFGCVYAADYHHDRVAVFAPDGTLYASLAGDASLTKWTLQFYNLHPQQRLDREAASPREMDRIEVGMRHPRGVRIDADGRVIVADSERHRLQVYERILFDLPPLGAKQLPSRGALSPVTDSFVRGLGGIEGPEAAAIRAKAAALSQSADDDVRRAWLATDWIVRTAAPAWLEAAGLAAEAAAVRSLPELKGPADHSFALETVEKARDVAYRSAWNSGAEPHHLRAFDEARAVTWPAARAAAATDLATAARNAVGASAWTAAARPDYAGTLASVRASALALFDLIA